MSGSNSGVVSCWSLCCGERLASWQAHSGAVSAVIALPNTDIISAGLDGRVSCWALLEDEHARQINKDVQEERKRRDKVR